MWCSRFFGLLAALAMPLSSIATAQVSPPPTATATPMPAPPTILPEGTPVIVTTATDLSTEINEVGDRFDVVVAEDVALGGVIVIPKGTIGRGEVSFATRKGSFGKPGILGIALRSLDLDGKSFVLDGRYREEGKDNDGAAAATMYAVGIFAALVKGKHGLIPKGRTLKARTGEDIPLAAVTTATSPADSPTGTAVAAPAPPAPAAVSPVIQ